MAMQNPCPFGCPIVKLAFRLFLVFGLLLPAQGDSLHIRESQAAAEEQRQTSSRQASTTQFACLPEGFQLKDKISDSRKENGSKQPLTIEDKLLELKARCKRGKLFDGKGKEIRLFKFSCIGNRQDNYREIAQKESEELADLQKRYTVIIIACGRQIN
jgi:hypothetical protein